jgi:DNA invertase Pin-like site-specific DNA recombinase
LHGGKLFRGQLAAARQREAGTGTIAARRRVAPMAGTIASLWTHGDRGGSMFGGSCGLRTACESCDDEVSSAFGRGTAGRRRLRTCEPGRAAAGPRFISPLVQREAIESWAARRGVRLLALFEELDESGSRADRPLLEQAIRRIELGVSDALVVWRVDRFGRSLLDGVRTIERIRAVGCGFYSVHDGLDVDTDAGRLVLRILLSVAEYQLDGIRAGWESAREHAIARGVYTGTTVPVGYRRARSGRLRPDPATAPVMTKLFARRARGDTLRTLCRFLESEGVRTGKGNPGWTTSSLSCVLRMRVYLGEVYCGPARKAAAHPVLTDAATWEAAQHPRLMEARRPIYGPSLLTGLVRCAGCRHILKTTWVSPPGRSPYLTYGCRKFHAGGTCPAPAHINAANVEPFVVDAVMRLLARRRRAPVSALAAAEARAAEAGQALVRDRDNDRLLATLGERTFLDGLGVRVERARDASLAVAELRLRAAVHELPPADQVRQSFPAMTLAEQRQLIGRVIDTAFVAAGHAPASHRVTVCPAGTAPRGLPRAGDRGGSIVAISPRRGWLNPPAPAS